MIIGSKPGTVARPGGLEPSPDLTGQAHAAGSAGAGGRRGSAGRGPAPGAAALPDADRENLEEERDFLLASLRDLEAEHGAGDIDDADYQALLDDYTVRAAAVLRALTAGRAPPDPGGEAGSDRAADSDGSERAARADGQGRRRRRRTFAIGAGIVVAGLLAAWAVTAASGSRLPNQPITGSLPGAKPSGGSTGVDTRLTQAAQLVQKGKITDALKLYDQVLKDRPNDPAALAEQGWVIAQAGVAGNQSDLVDQGLAEIQAAEQSDASYPDAHFFRGFLLFRAKADPAGAVPELRQYLALVDPSSPDVPQVEQVLNAALAAVGPTGPAAPKPTTTSTP